MIKYFIIDVKLVYQINKCIVECSNVGGDILEVHIITAQQDKMIDMLLSGENISDIAKILNVARSTIYEWKRKPLVMAELETRRSELKKTAQDKITSDVCTYIDNMKQMANQKTDNRVRYQANKFLIEQCLGKATTIDEKNISPTGNDKDNKNANELKAELEDIKNLKVIK